MVTENTTMITDNIFSGLKVVDLSSLVAGPGGAVILSDFGADVIKVEPPKGEVWRLANRDITCYRWLKTLIPGILTTATSVDLRWI